MKLMKVYSSKFLVNVNLINFFLFLSIYILKNDIIFYYIFHDISSKKKLIFIIHKYVLVAFHKIIILLNLKRENYNNTNISK